MEKEVVVSCWQVWKRYALSLGPEGLARLELQKWEKIDNTA